IRKYCGIPEPDLNAQHALDVYVFMSSGYHQYGIEWDARPVNLEPIREETRRIVVEERAKRAALQAGETNLQAKLPPQPATNLPSSTKPETTPETPQRIMVEALPPEFVLKVTVSRTWLWGSLGALALIFAAIVFYLKRRRS